MNRVTKSELQMDANYLKDVRSRIDRAHDRINELTLERTQLRVRVKLLNEGFDSLNEKYIAVCKELQVLKGTTMETKTAVDILIERLKQAQADIYELYPPPYEYPSDLGRVTQLASDSLNMAEIIKRKTTTN